ncbi:hypothetical protein [Dyadobacter sp. LHD-138]|uniref:hypothetical protein n=1 Tax=Dyadobacter sp. LHD-138 TaxID=3071413 RepID=UPI0027DF7C9C|nr:hypothetical protein [Dyadobacter sp. LHD-138]MDQ6480274.1 hypothetical protein [Dyadobacter sp. LHD-138]
MKPEPGRKKSPGIGKFREESTLGLPFSKLDSSFPRKNPLTIASSPLPQSTDNISTYVFQSFHERHLS